MFKRFCRISAAIIGAAVFAALSATACAEEAYEHEAQISRALRSFYFDLYTTGDYASAVDNMLPNGVSESVAKEYNELSEGVINMYDLDLLMDECSGYYIEDRGITDGAKIKDISIRDMRVEEESVSETGGLHDRYYAGMSELVEVTYSVGVTMQDSYFEIYDESFDMACLDGKWYFYAADSRDILGGTETVWDGTTPLTRGDYVITEDVVLSEKLIVPSGCNITVEDGATLTVERGGYLYIAGNFTVDSGAKLDVKGKIKLIEYRSLTCFGEIALGERSEIRLDGKLTLYNGARLGGNPRNTVFNDGFIIDVNGMTLADFCDDDFAERFGEYAADTAADMTMAMMSGKVSETLVPFLPEGTFDVLAAEFEKKTGVPSEEYYGLLDAMNDEMMADYLYMLEGAPDRVSIYEYEVQLLLPSEMEIDERFGSLYEDMWLGASLSAQYHLSTDVYTIAVFISGLYANIDGQWYYVVTADEINVA